MQTVYNESCYGLSHLSDRVIDTIITDCPYGLNLNSWDHVPDKGIWQDCFRVLKPGGYLASFSSIKYQHRITQDILDAGFDFRDVLLWVFLNGRVPPLDADHAIDDYLGNDREITGEYKYKQGTPLETKAETYTLDTKRFKTKAKSNAALHWDGFGRGLKTCYEPIILVQKPLDGTLGETLVKWGVGSMNLAQTRVPYDDGEEDVGHNPHPDGRVMGNIVQTEEFGDYQRFFFVGKVRDGKKTGNTHNTVKPVNIMKVLVELLSRPGQTILDPFAGSGTTGVAAIHEQRDFIGYEIDPTYYEICQQRLKAAEGATAYSQDIISFGDTAAPRIG